MSSTESKKYAYLVMSISVSLIALRFGLGVDKEIKIPTTGVSVPINFLWVALVFMLIPYARELSQNKLQPLYLWKNKLNSDLCTWSRLYVKAKWPDYVAPLIDVSYKGMLVWSCVYHQAGSNREPSYEARSGFFTTLRIGLFSAIKVLLNLRVLELFTVPVTVVLICIFSWFVWLW